jgi:hypothetical protein
LARVTIDAVPAAGFASRNPKIVGAPADGIVIFAALLLAFLRL